MSVDFEGNYVTKLQVLQENKPLSTNQWTIVLTVSSVVIILLLTVSCLCRRKSKKLKRKKKIVHPTTNTTEFPVYFVQCQGQIRTTEDVTRRYERSVSSASTKSQVYLVPFDVLPANFDWTSRDVEVRADYVILKDLSILERCRPSTSANGIVNEAYEKQEPYHPNVVQGSIPFAFVDEQYQKQSPYNPTFY